MADLVVLKMTVTLKFSNTTENTTNNRNCKIRQLTLNNWNPMYSEIKFYEITETNLQTYFKKHASKNLQKARF